MKRPMVSPRPPHVHVGNNGIQGQDLRTDVDAVVVPVAAGHVLVDVGVDARHLGRSPVAGRRRRRRWRMEDGGRGEETMLAMRLGEAAGQDFWRRGT